MNKEDYAKKLALHGQEYKRPKPRLVSLTEDHPFYCMTYKGRVAEGRLIMAKHLGRPLTRNEIVSYKDDFPLNTSLDNLELRDRQYIYDNRIEWGLDNDIEGSKNYHLGKKEEERVATYLANVGYCVVDISRTRHYNQDGTVLYSPYDIYAWSENYSFLADVKYRSSKGDIYFNTSIVDKYNDYWKHISVDARVIIIATPGLVDLSIDISDLDTSTKLCIIERWKAQPISYLVSRREGIIPEKSYNNMKFLHLERDSTSPSGYKILGWFPYPQESK